MTLTATLALNVAGASASDLLVLNGDPPAMLSGTLQYGIVYIDGELRLTGDTTICSSRTKLFHVSNGH